MNRTGNPQTNLAQLTFPFSEAANHLQTEPHQLWNWSQRFAPFLGDSVVSDHPRYSVADVATLRTIQVLLSQGYDDEEITVQLASVQDNGRPTPVTRAAPTTVDGTKNSVDSALAPIPPTDLRTAQSLGDVFAAIADGQKAILNNQSTVREIVGVLVQDNFNLKGENRKLRERMLEIERSLAEYQRREETRKERMESRLRALESTVGGLQQQLAQLVQMLRKPKRGWFW